MSSWKNSEANKFSNSNINLGDGPRQPNRSFIIPPTTADILLKIRERTFSNLNNESYSNNVSPANNHFYSNNKSNLNNNINKNTRELLSNNNLMDDLKNIVENTYLLDNSIYNNSPFNDDKLNSLVNILVNSNSNNNHELLYSKISNLTNDRTFSNLLNYLFKFLPLYNNNFLNNIYNIFILTDHNTELFNKLATIYLCNFNNSFINKAIH